MHKRGRAAQPGQDVPKPAPPTPVCGPRKPGAAANSNQARIADREELGVLRELAQSLEHKLAELQATQRRVAAVATQPSNAKRDDRAVELWREIANRQIEQQVTAEAENRRLRNVMDAQNKLLAELQSQIFGRSTSKVRVCACSRTGVGAVAPLKYGRWIFFRRCSSSSLPAAGYLARC